MSASEDYLNNLFATEQPATAPSDQYLNRLFDAQRNGVLQTVAGTSPEQAVKRNRLSRTFGVDQRTIASEQAKFEQTDTINQAKAIIAGSPLLQRHFTDADFASVAYDDTSNLAAIGHALTRTARDTGVALTKSAVALPKGIVGLADISQKIFNPINFFVEDDDVIGGHLEDIGIDFERTQNILSHWYSPATQQATQNVAAAQGFGGTLAAIAANPSAALATLGESTSLLLGGAAIGRGLARYLPALYSAALGEGALQAGLSAENLRAAGPEQVESLTGREALAATGSGIGTALVTLLGGAAASRMGFADPEQILTAGLREADPVTKARFGLSILGAGVTEGVFEELPQSMQEQMWQNFATGQPLLEGVGHAGAMGVAVGLPMGSTFGGVQAIATRKVNQAKQAQEAFKDLQDTAKLAEASKVRERDQTTFESFVRDAAEEGDVSTVYLDSQVLMQSGNADELAAISPSIAEQYEQAAATGGTIAIPMEEYASRIAPSEYNDELMPQLRVGDPEAFTAQEADDYIDNMQAELDEQAETMVSQLGDRSEFDQSAERVKQVLTDELAATGRLAEHNVEPTAQLYSSYYNVRAAQLGITPEQMLERVRVGFQAAKQAEVQQLQQANFEQPADYDFDETQHRDSIINWAKERWGDQIAENGKPVWQNFAAWFGDSAVVDDEGRPLVVYHGTPESFDEFDNPVGVPNIYFTTDPDVAAEYAEKDPSGQANIVPVMLSAQDPMTFDAGGAQWDAIPLDVLPGEVAAYVAENRGGDTIPLTALTAVAKHFGNDSVIVHNVIDGVGPVGESTPATVAIVTDSSQAKSAIANEGTFSPDTGNILLQSEPRNLYVSHNLSAENLKAADELGGLAAPSLAVGNIDVQALTGFGDITLLAEPGLLQSHKVRTFDADVYSPRQPRAEYDIKGGPVLAKMKASPFDMPDVDELSATDGPFNFARSDAAKYVYLEEQGKLPRLYNAKVDPEIRKAAKANDEDAIERYAIAYYQRTVEALREELGADDPLAKMKGGLYFTEDGELSMRFYAEFRGKVLAYRRTDGKDMGRFRADIDKRLRQPTLNKKYEAWATAQFNSIIAGKKLFKGFDNSGDKRYSEYTLANVVKEMTRELRNGENWNYGAGSVRSAYAEELNNTAAIQAKRDDIVTTEEMDAIRTESNERLLQTLEDLKPFYKFESNSFMYTDDASAAIAEGPRGWREAFELNDESEALITDLIEYLRALPTEYFESKAQRAVQLDEFDTAIVPKGTDKATIDILKSHGIKIRRYEAEDQESRAEAIRSAKKTLFFQQARGAFNPEDFTISLLEGSDLSTALHEGAHFFFEADVALAGQLLDEARQFGDEVLSDGEREILDNVHNLFTWHGIEGPLEEQLATWAGLDNEQRRYYHERTAETFEHYLFSGQAPSFELQAYFQRFRAWMLGVYKNLELFLKRNNRAQDIDPDIKAVFDRMLATTEQIQIAEQGRSMMPLFDNPEESGMTPEEYDDYQRTDVNASNDATEELQAKALRDLKYQRNIRNDELKRLRKESEEVRREVRIAVRREVMQQPVYQAWQWLTAKLGEQDKLPSTEQPQRDSVDPTRDSLFVAMAKMGGINREEIVNQWGLDPADAKGIGYGYKNQPVVRAEGGQSLDAMREALREDGYLGGDFGATTDALQSNQHDFEQAFFSELSGDEQFSRAYVPQAEMEPGEQAANPDDVTAGRLDVEALQLEYSDEQIAQLKSYRMTGKNGWAPDLVAERFGYDSGEALIHALLTTTPPSAWIEVMTDRRMAEQHAELATEEALEQAADAAIHNRARARVVATEANALDKAIGGKRALMRAAGEMADAVIARLQLREIQPRRYASAAARAAAAAKRAFKKGETEVAATEKRNELAQLQIANKAYKARQEADKHLRYLRKFNRSKLSLDPEYLAQIQGLLEKYELRSISDKQQLRNELLRDWVLGELEAGKLPIISEQLLAPDERAEYLAKVGAVMPDGTFRYDSEEKRIELLAQYIENGKRRPYKSLTIEELRALVDTVKQIEHLGRFKNQLLTDRQNRTVAQVEATGAASVQEHSKGRKAKNRTPSTELERKAGRLNKFITGSIKVTSLIEVLDGGPNGFLWNMVVRPANHNADWQTTQNAELTERLTGILEPFLRRRKAFNKEPGSAPGEDSTLQKVFDREKKYFPAIGESLTRENVLVIALNMGNLGNRQRLLDGYGWSEDQLAAVLSSLSTEEWHAVEQVWDLFEEYWPLIEAKETRVYGVAPERVPRQPFYVTTADGDTIRLEGGYYPAKYDPEASARVQSLQDAANAADQKYAAFTSATTRRSHAHARAAEVKGRPLLLSLDGLYNGFSEVVHDLAWHEWLIDMNRIFRPGSQIHDAIFEHYGANYTREIKLWLERIGGQDRQTHVVGETLVSKLRMTTGAAILGFSASTSILQLTGFVTSIPRVGLGWMIRGLQRYLANPVGATREAMQISSVMRNRARTQFRELNELRGMVEGKKGITRSVMEKAFVPIQKFQQVTDTIVWMAAYEKFAAEHGYGKDARDLADQIVKSTQVSGELMDRARAETGDAYSKLFTLFYSFPNTQLNQIYISAKTSDSKAEFAADYFWIIFMNAAIYAVYSASLTPGGDDDEEDQLMQMAKMLAAENVSSLMGMFVFVREVSNLPAILMGQNAFSYRGPAGTQPLTNLTRLGLQVSQGEMDEAFFNAVLDTAGSFTGLPANQIGKTIEGVQAISEGKTDNPVESARALAFGFNEQ